MILQFTHRFEAAHRFLNDSSKCSTPHGHSWYVTIKLQTKSDHFKQENNFSHDFYDLKKDWRKFVDEELDHHFFANSQDPLLAALKKEAPQARVKMTPGDPTTEALAALFFNKAEVIFKNFAGVSVQEMELKETPTNSLRIDKGDRDFFFKLHKIKSKSNWWD